MTEGIEEDLDGADCEDSQYYDTLRSLVNADLGDFSNVVNFNLEKSAFVRVDGDDGSRVIKKSAAVWFLENSIKKLSSDRTLRVMQSSTFQDRQKITVRKVEKRNVRIGDWSVFKYQHDKGKLLIGRVLSLAIMDGKRTEGSKFVWEWVIGEKNSEKVGALCVWYDFRLVSARLSGKLIEANLTSHGFFH